MKPSDRRELMKQEMGQRARESYNTKDESGKFKNIFLKDKMGNVAMWKCSEDEHFINIIPFIAGDFHPTVKKGKPAYFLDIWVHRKVGVGEDTYVCLARTFNKPCAICDAQATEMKKDDYDEKYTKSLNPTRRAIYNIECLDNDKEVKKKIQIFDVSHYLFEKELAELSKKPRDGGFVLFADPDEGKTIFFRKSGKSATNTEYKGFRFEERSAPISDELLDGALCLDELIHIPTYEEVQNAFYGTELDPEISETAMQEGKIEDEISGSMKEDKKEDLIPENISPNDSFQCPGSAPEDFGNFPACDTCPDVSECEAEFKKLEQEKANKEAAKKETPPAESPSERRARLMNQGTTSEQVKPSEQAATTTVDGTERRIRRRPGQ